MRGYYSQGVVICLNQYSNLVQAKHGKDALINLSIPNEGDDLTEYLQVEKYEPQEIDSSVKSGDAAGLFIRNVPETDENRIQTFTDDKFNNIKKIDDVFIISEKIDGMSFTAAIQNGEFKVCSHRLQITESEESIY